MIMVEQILLPLRGLVNFFSPPAPSMLTSRTAMPLKLAKAPALPSGYLTRSKPTIVQTQAAGIRLVHPMLLGSAPRRPQATVPHMLRSRRAQDGRIVIAGRLGDVCAELDRLCQEV
jgi:hypothetical protein